MREVFDEKECPAIVLDRKRIRIKPATIVRQIVPPGRGVRAQINDVRVAEKAPAHTPVRCVVTETIDRADGCAGKRLQPKMDHRSRVDGGRMTVAFGLSRPSSIERSVD